MNSFHMGLAVILIVSLFALASASPVGQPRQRGQDLSPELAYFLTHYPEYQLMAQHRRQQMEPQRRFRANAARGRLVAPANDLVEYDDFEEAPPMAAMSYAPIEAAWPEGLKPKGGKRYLGIDIPDYISAGGKSADMKSMQEKMKALGKRKR